MSKNSDHVKEWRRNTKQRMITAMGGKCAICDYNRSSNAMEFHHLDPTEKEMGFGRSRSHPAAWERIVVELRKCVMLCCRCHREVHEGIAQVPDDYPTFDENLADYKGLRASSAKDACPVCQTPKPRHMVTCSRLCAGKNRNKVNWDAFDIVSLVESGESYQSIGRRVGVTGAAVTKRYRKLKANVAV